MLIQGAPIPVPYRNPVNLFPASNASHLSIPIPMRQEHTSSGGGYSWRLNRCLSPFIAFLVGALIVILIRKHIAKSTNEYHQTRHFRESRVAALDNEEYTGCKQLPAPGSTVPEMTWEDKIEIEMQDAEDERVARLGREAEELRMRGVHEMG